MGRKEEEHRESQARKIRGSSAIGFLLMKREKLLSHDQKEEITVAEAYFGPWRPVGQNEKIPENLKQHVDTINGISMVPTRIFDQRDSSASNRSREINLTNSAQQIPTNNIQNKNANLGEHA